MKSKALLSGPAGDFRQVSGEVINANNQLYYRSLSDDELVRALRQSMSKLKSASVRMTQELRAHLLPALCVLRERYHQPGRRNPVPGKPTYYEVLRSLNLKPDTVRKWFKPTVSAGAVLQLLDDGRERTWPSHPKVERSATQHLLATADKMAEKLLDGNIKAATRLAREYSEARNS